MTIGEKIATARKQAGLTQTDLARILEMPYQTIGHWERDKSSPKFSSLERVAAALHISVEDLICGKPVASAKPVPICHDYDPAIQKLVSVKYDVGQYIQKAESTNRVKSLENIQNQLDRIIIQLLMARDRKTSA